MTDPAMAFWLRYVEECGGLWEPAGDSALVVLPPELGQRYQLADELQVTSDPDVAREDRATFLGTGHPVLTEAAEAVLVDGDAGLLVLERPSAARPDDGALLERARGQLPVRHGRIDLAGPSHPVTRWLLRAGALVGYAVSAEDMFQEQVERWVDLASLREVPARVVARLAGTPAADKATQPAAPSGELAAGVREADRLIEAAALRRRAELSKQLDGSHEQERARAESYYADVIAGIRRRLATVAADRHALLEERLASTREEQTRRLAEIAEKHQPRHDIRPYRLHLVGVPAVRLPVHVRRGDRRYPLELDWLAPAGGYAEPRCPACAAAAPLVAGKSKLGCLSCLTPATPSGPPPKPASGAAPATKPPPDPSPVERPRPPAKPPPAKRTAPRQPATVATPRSGTPRVAPKQAERLAAAVWNAVAAGRSRKLRDVIAPGSPAAALHRLYGVDGPRHATGLPAHETPTNFTTGAAWLTERSGYCAGVVQTEVSDYPYALHWYAEGRALWLAEVLAYPPHADGHLSGFYWMFGGGRRLAHAPVDVPSLSQDPVARLLVSAGVPRDGLSVTARALAAWWRLGDRLLRHDQPAAVAAAIHRLVASRAGGRGRFREAADAYQVDEAAMRRTDALLRKQLGLGPGRAW